MRDSTKIFGIERKKITYNKSFRYICEKNWKSRSEDYISSGFGRWKSARNGRVAGLRSVTNLEINMRRGFRPEKNWRIITACQSWAFFVSPPTFEQCRLRRSNDGWTIVGFCGSRRPGGREAKLARGQLLQRYRTKGNAFHEILAKRKNQHGGSISTRMVHKIYKN